ncbi:unnamed protein product [Zymoseptoria tritici ST99CH_3D7]|uniref:Uncharacterized protein n=1 Tax=Zymoseptoria tritici (strain ST99CH_3D7) TaxID=1276538 RepID=A0A1X7RMC5_ZYMT9|nr:unnamed protein product [Zymoseptoria tritici ST99CH_3D7]
MEQGEDKGHDEKDCYVQDTFSRIVQLAAEDARMLSFSSSLASRAAAITYYEVWSTTTVIREARTYSPSARARQSYSRIQGTGMCSESTFDAYN